MSAADAVSVPVSRFLQFAGDSGGTLPLEALTEKHDEGKALTTGDINRPGMNLFGYFEYFAHERIQVFGRGESTYLATLHREGRILELERFFTYPMPLILFSYGTRPPAEFIAMAEARQVPVYMSTLSTPQLIIKIQEFFTHAVAPMLVVNGVMLEVFSLGILLVGEPGVGKSECALELIERGHRFIADDTIEIKAINHRSLLAAPSRISAYHMKISGLGILNIAHLFGVGAIRPEKQIDVIIELDADGSGKASYDQTGLDDQTDEILGIRVPRIRVPVRAGSNLPVLVETASMNQRLKMMGYHSAREFTKKVHGEIERGAS